MSDKIKETLKPVQEQLAVVLASLSDLIIPKAISAFEEVKPASDKVGAELLKLANGQGGDNVEELEKLNKEMLQATEDRLLKLLKEVAEVCHAVPHHLEALHLTLFFCLGRCGGHQA